jgi:cytochrome d ubiquinol oxidase subunit I
MQTPQGFIIENGHLIPQDWLAIIFNPLSRIACSIWR